ncbi:MAG: hypothetical protein ACXWK2_05850 [Rhizomicrobium sp.]
MTNSNSGDGEVDLGEEHGDDEIANASTIAMSRAETPNVPAAGKRSGGNLEEAGAGHDRKKSGGDKK